jgi:hypothetical protein
VSVVINQRIIARSHKCRPFESITFGTNFLRLTHSTLTQTRRRLYCSKILTKISDFQGMENGPPSFHRAFD